MMGALTAVASVRLNAERGGEVRDRSSRADEVKALMTSGNC